MKNIVSNLYSDYLRYTDRFRAIPWEVDMLKPVERRCLLSIHETAKTRFVKTAKVIGHIIGNYHPHGDVSIYKTLVNLVDQGYAVGQGNWGSPGLHDDPPASYRYTEVKLEKWVEELAFEYTLILKVFEST